ncbi:MAG TPA: hypothetical protein VGE39_06515 [Prosthecobacter sp.]
MSSSNNSAAPSRLYSVRLARWLFRLVWNRFVGWMLVCLISLLTLYYQWENRRSARELEAAYERMLRRIGTDSVLTFAAPTIPDEQNYFALPVVERWGTGTLAGPGGFKHYPLEKDVFLPPGFVKPTLSDNGDGTSTLDLASWAPGRDLKGEPPAVVVNQELGDANGLLPPLAAGLGRPFSCIKPGHRQALEAAGANPYEAAFPHIRSINDHMKALGLHLRCAAAAGDVPKTRDVALILLRLFPESAASHGTLISSLVSTAAHGIAFDALREALGRPVWDEAGLHALQMQLGKINDLEVVDRALSTETLLGFGAGIYIREAVRRGDRGLYDWLRINQGNDWASRLANFASASAATFGPTGWHDANIAFFVDRQLDVLGPKGEAAWTDAARRGVEVKKRLEVEYQHLHWNPRRFIGAIMLPNIGNIFDSAAEMLFHRRCLIIACALEKHRLEQGSYPASLDTVRDDLRPFQVADPARPPRLPGYRVEKEGYILWSAGPDAQDDGGVKDKDWLWRMRLAEP